MNQDRFTTALAVLIVVAISLSTTIASARTWRVEKDGSGDFAVIQDAVDVAASGDTVVVGVGRFDDRFFVTSPGWSDSVRVLVTQHELTIIGSGDETIIGQEEPWDLEQGNHKGIVASDFWGNAIVRIQGIRFENMRTGLYSSYETIVGSRVEIRDCTFHAHRRALTLISVDVGGEILVEDCLFNGMARDGSQVHCWRQDKFTMRRCVSTLAYDPLWNRDHFGSWGVAEVLIEECDFVGGTAGMDFFTTDFATVRNCRFEGQGLFALAPLDGSYLVVEGCTFRYEQRVLEVNAPGASVSFSGNTIDSIGDCSFLLKYAFAIEANENDIPAGERGAVWINEISNCDAPGTLDFTNNYWFTDHPDSIAAWIRDRNDNDQVCYYVEFDPFRSESTPIERRSLADIKRLFRR